MKAKKKKPKSLVTKKVQKPSKKVKPVKSQKKFSVAKKKKISSKITSRKLTKKPSADKKKNAGKMAKVMPKPAVKKSPISKKIHQPKPAPFAAESFFKAKIKVIGLGGGGGSIVSEIGRSLNKATFVVADTDMRAFKKRSGIKYFLFGQELTHGLGTGLNVELARQAAEQEKESIAKLFKDQDIVIFIASLGGGLGSGATQVFAEAAKDFGGITFGIFTLPFKFEGKNKYKIASRALRDLRKSLNVSITIPNERIFKVIEANTAITDAFSLVNRSLIESLESLIDLIYSPGVINIDFADLRAILKGRGNLAFLNTAESSGQDKADKIIHDILHNPLYQNNNFNVEKVLFNIAGGNKLSMFEVDKISRAISETNPSAKIIFGISKNTKYKNKIKTTLLMTGSPTAAEAVVAPKVEAVKKEETKKEPAPVKIAETKVPKKVKKKSVKKDMGKKSSQKEQKALSMIDSIPIFNPSPALEPTTKLSIQETSVSPLEQKKAIRRSALDIKKAEEMEENKKSPQEEEWEIPAFLRKVHRIK